uniref:Beta-1,4-N-acetylgalactosaminyltransferase n=1 Tax=Rhabditophanes sp. KR3021 TaxID=114890 RepID=A0AC35U540_9BILA
MPIDSVFSQHQFKTHSWSKSGKSQADIFVSNDTYNTIFQYADGNICEPDYEGLVGRIPVYLDGPNFTTLNSLYPNVQAGGHYFPPDCQPAQKVAILVPFKNRYGQLRVFLHNLHSTLRKQKIDYTIILIEPVGNVTFNRGKLLNIGFVEAQKLYDFDCFIFHDVDLIPEDDRNLYNCGEMPRHMSASINKFNYELPYQTIFGGASAISKQQFIKVNGYFNDYWGWGMEDDDLYIRIKHSGMRISRFPMEISRYYMINHKREPSNQVNSERISIHSKTIRKYKEEGLNNLAYKVMEVQLYQLYTKIMVDVLEEESTRLMNEKYA